MIEDLYTKAKQEVGADGTQTDVEHEDADQEESEPFDPEEISIDGKVVPMDTLIRRLLQGTIRLAPAFQRKEVWDEKRKSQLIESLMLKIPLPMFYVASDENGNWDVVDGLQRLSTIKDFVLGEKYMQSREDGMRGDGLKLDGLEFWGDKYNESNFNQLPELLSNRILETEFQFTIINPGTPEEVKRNIFKRINTGGMPLSPQEIRNALYQGHSTVLLEELVSDSAFIKATLGSVNDSRMAGRELVLRSLAFSIRDKDEYPKNSDMDLFLSDTMRLMNIMPEMPTLLLKKIFKNRNLPHVLRTDIQEIKKRFIIGMERCLSIFGYHTFRKSQGKNYRSPINKTLFEVWSNIIADLNDDEFASLNYNKENFLQDYIQLLDNEDFIGVISRYSLKKPSIEKRYDSLRSLVKKYI